MSELTIKTNKGFGWRPDIPDFRDKKFSAMRAEAVQFKPKALIPSSRLIPVYDQLQTSSCVGNAGSTLFSYVRKVSPRSRLQLYYEARRLIGETNKDEGCYIRDVIKVMANLGAARESLWPFHPRKICIDPPLNVDKDALQRKIFKYYRLEGRNDFRTCLAANMPFIIGISLYDSFMSPEVERFGIVNMPSPREPLIGGHAVLFIGYDSNFRDSIWAKEAIAAGFSAEKIPNDVYIVRNSWSSRWGRKGNFAIDAKYAEHYDLAADAWTIRNA